MRETGDGDDLARWIFLNRWDGGPIEGEKDDAEEGGELLVRGPGWSFERASMTKAELTIEKKTRLQEPVRYLTRANDEQRTNIKVVLRPSLYLLT